MTNTLFAQDTLTFGKSSDDSRPPWRLSGAALCRLAPFDVLPWERRFFVASARPGIDLVALSMGRGGGKTAAAGVMAAGRFLEEERRGRPSDVVIVASTTEQARIGGRDAVRVLTRDRFDLAVRDSYQRLEVENPRTGTRLRCIPSTSSTAHGLRPSTVIADEPAQWGKRGEELWAALLTALGKVPGGRVVLLGTRPDQPDHWYQRLLDAPPDRSVVIVYAGDPDADPMDRRQWHKANPGLRYGVPERAVIEREAREATRDSSALARFRALRLNAGVPAVDAAGTLLDAGVWATLPSAPAPAGDYALGLDLGGGTSLTAAAAYWPACGRLEAICGVGTIPTLAQRGSMIGSPGAFLAAEASGRLVVTEGRNADPAALLRSCEDRWGIPAALAADRYRQALLLDALDALGWGVPVSWRGRGQHQAEDIHRFRTRCHDGRVAPDVHELLDRSIYAVQLQADTAGNWTVAHRANRPDDLAVAAVLAVASGDRWQ